MVIKNKKNSISKHSNSRSDILFNRNLLMSKRSNSRFDFVTKNNILSKSKRSQSHVEVFLSFVIFIGFLLFIFIFLNPFAKAKPNYIMDNIQKAVVKVLLPTAVVVMKFLNI